MHNFTHSLHFTIIVRASQIWKFFPLKIEKWCCVNLIALCKWDSRSRSRALYVSYAIRLFFVSVQVHFSICVFFSLAGSWRVSMCAFPRFAKRMMKMRAQANPIHVNPSKQTINKGARVISVFILFHFSSLSLRNEIVCRRNRCNTIHKLTFCLRFFVFPKCV